MKTENVQMERMSGILRKVSRFGGLVTGYPTNKTFGESQKMQIERLCKGMNGDSFAYVIMAKCVDSFKTTLAHEHTLNEIDEVSKFLKTTETGGKLGKQTWESTNLHAAALCR